MVHIHRVETEGLAQVSFIVAARSGEALVIDPRRDVEIYLDLAQAHGLTLRYVVDTHIHADYASGAPELAARSGARLLLRGLTNSVTGGPQADDPFVAHGGVLTLGELRITALQTPGHTPEHRCLLLEDGAEPEAAALLFSGDTLFVGSLGRPDLLGDDETRELAEAMHATLHDVLLPLADDTLVYPGHGAGSACGGGIGGGARTTLGQERSSNPYFQFGPQERDAFVAELLRDLPPVPSYFPLMKRLNADGAPAPPSGLPPVVAWAALRAWQAAAAPGVLLDVRDADAFAAGHLHGAVHIGVGDDGNLANWAGWTLPYDQPVTLLARDHDQVRAAQTWLARVGYDTVAGYALLVDTEEETLAALVAQGLQVCTLRSLTPAETQAALATEQPMPQVLDIRTQAEWDAGHIAGSIHAPLQELIQVARGSAGTEHDALAPLPDVRDALPTALERESPVLVICASGYRSSLAASLLERAGLPQVGTVAGGIESWQAAGLPTVTAPEQESP